MTGLTTKQFVANSKRGTEYNASIQNLSGESLTVTVTNEDIQGSSPTFDTPAAGALVIANGAVGELNEPYDGWLLTLGAGGSGFIHINESGA
jgi:hypothetical protein